MTTAIAALAAAKDSMIEKIVNDDAFRRENHVKFFHVLSPFNPLTTDAQFAAAFAYDALAAVTQHAITGEGEGVSFRTEDRAVLLPTSDMRPPKEHRYGFLRMFDGLFRQLGIRTSPSLVATVIAVPGKMYDPTMPDGVTAMAIAFVNPKEVGSRAAGRAAATDKLFAGKVHFLAKDKVDSLEVFKSLIDPQDALARVYAMRLRLAFKRRDG